MKQTIERYDNGERKSIKMRISDFHSIQLHLETPDALKQSSAASKSCMHTMFIKKHEPLQDEIMELDGDGGDIGDHLSDRTLFIMHPPFTSSLAAFKAQLSQKILRCPIGNVDVRNLQKSASGYVTSDLVLLVELDGDSVNADQVLDLLKNNKSHKWSARFVDFETEVDDEDEVAVELGLDRYLAEYRQQRPDSQEYQHLIDDQMMQYDQEVADRYNDIKERRNVVDEDGWVLVTRAGRRNTNTDGKVSVTAAKPQDIAHMLERKKQRAAEKLKKMDHRLPSLYDFKERETKLDKLAELRRKFEHDKQRIATMKANRKFKPY